MIDQRAIENALAALRGGLSADGFDLRAGTLYENDVQIVLEAKPDACLDCLVSDELLLQMIDDAIRHEDASLGQVRLTKLGFDGLAKH